MEAHILKSFGEYILRYNSPDLEEIRALADFVKYEKGHDYKDNVY